MELTQLEKKRENKSTIPRVADLKDEVQRKGIGDCFYPVT